MYKIGVIGDKDSILGFKALGFTVQPVANPEQAAKAINDMADQNYAVIYIVEHTAKDVMETINEYREKMLPAIIPIPGNQGSLGIGISGVKKTVEQAIGADILFRDE